MALNHRPICADKKVIICVLRFIQFVLSSMRNPVVIMTHLYNDICLVSDILSDRIYVGFARLLLTYRLTLLLCYFVVNTR